MFHNYGDSTDMQIQAQQLTPNDQEALELIKHCSKQELQELLENEDKLIGLINDLQQVKRLQTDREMTIVKNKSMADYNLSFEPKLTNLKSTIAADYEEANTLKTELATGKSKLDTVRGEVSLDVINLMLQTEAATSEKDSEKLADDFCEGKLDIDNFVDSFIALRTVSHLRQIKSQKMNELVREHSPTRHVPQNNPSWNSGPKSPSAAPYPSYNSGPYSAGGYSMPEPNYYAR